MSFERIHALLESAGAMELRIDNPCDWIAVVPHGFRSSFRDQSAQETDHPREVVEAALAYAVQNKVESAYVGARTCSGTGLG